MLRDVLVLLFVGAPTGLLTACGETTTPCPPRMPLAAVDVEIREAGINLPLAETARGTIRDGSHIDSLQPGRRESGFIISRQAGFERAGTYEVEVVHAGYATWRKTGVVVRSVPCRIETAKLQATLQPTS